MMKIYRLTRTINGGYDTYDACIVVANNEKEAKTILPSMDYDGYELNNIKKDDEHYEYSSWCIPENVEAEYIGETDKYKDPCCILASFNAS